MYIRTLKKKIAKKIYFPYNKISINNLTQFNTGYWDIFFKLSVIHEIPKRMKKHLCWNTKEIMSVNYGTSNAGKLKI